MKKLLLATCAVIALCAPAMAGSIGLTPGVGQPVFPDGLPDYSHPAYNPGSPMRAPASMCVATPDDLAKQASSNPRKFDALQRALNFRIQHCITPQDIAELRPTFAAIDGDDARRAAAEQQRAQDHATEMANLQAQIKAQQEQVARNQQAIEEKRAALAEKQRLDQQLQQQRLEAQQQEMEAQRQQAEAQQQLAAAKAMAAVLAGGDLLTQMGHVAERDSFHLGEQLKRKGVSITDEPNPKPATDGRAGVRGK